MVALERTPKLKLWNEEPQDNRRIFGRIERHFCVEARRISHSLSALRQPRLMLEVRDLSLGGISALSQQPIEQGEKVTIFFPSRNAQPAWDAYGRVVRCEASATGYRVAVEFDPLPAA